MPTTMRGALWALALAGGDGTRLQPLTRALTGAPIPKQYCRILGEESLLEATLARSAPIVPPARTLAIVNRDHLALARAQLRSLPPENVVVQPCNRDTGPGLVLCLLELARRDPDATVAIFPSDHWVGDGSAFRDAVARMARVVALFPDKIALLGIPPDRPDAGLGYVLPGEPLAGARTRPAFRVAAFAEKPAPDVAAQLIARGALWNAFVMVVRVRSALELVRRVRPGDPAALAPALAAPGGLARAYRRLEPWSFSTGVLTRLPQHLAVVRAEGLGWSDWGTPEAVATTLTALGVPAPWLAAGATLAATA